MGCGRRVWQAAAGLGSAAGFYGRVTNSQELGDEWAPVSATNTQHNTPHSGQQTTKLEQQPKPWIHCHDPASAAGSLLPAGCDHGYHNVTLQQCGQQCVTACMPKAANRQLGHTHPDSAAGQPSCVCSTLTWCRPRSPLSQTTTPCPNPTQLPTLSRSPRSPQPNTTAQDKCDTSAHFGTHTRTLLTAQHSGPSAEAASCQPGADASYHAPNQ